MVAQRHVCRSGTRTSEAHLRTTLEMPSGPEALNGWRFLMQWWIVLSGSVEKGSGVGGGSESSRYGGRWCGFGRKNISLRTATFFQMVSCVATVSLEVDLVYNVGMHIQLPSDNGFCANRAAFQMSCSVISSSQSFQCITLAQWSVEL